jgi:DNA-binding SARP family transcriptional activator
VPRSPTLCPDPAAVAGRPSIEVSVLGPVEIQGAARPFQRPAARELVVYLAFHPRGARSDVWGEALWPGRCVAATTIHSTASDARGALGRRADGTLHLPRSGRHLRLAGSVGTDADRFADAAADSDPERWREALGLVRGRLFEGLHLSDWAVLEGTQAELESLVVLTALRGAEHFLRHRRTEDAEWMIRRGLRVGPYDERLYRALLRVAEATGNRLGVRSALAEVLSLAAEVGAGPGRGRNSNEPEGAARALHPRTVALYRELAGRGA